ncbi:MAG: class I SAM-dependent methyltransferase [Anaerolineae bacterium]
MSAPGRPFVEADLESARQYDAWYESPGGRRMAGAEEALLADLLANYPGATSVLEVGCGTGHFTRRFACRGLRAAGLDASPAMLAVAVERQGGPAYVRGWAESLPFPDGSFDVVAFVTSLEFLADQAAAFREARRVGRLGVLLGVLNLASPLGLRRKAHACFRPSPYRAAHFYTPWDLARSARRGLGSGTRIAALRTVLWPAWIPVPLRWLPFGAFIGAAVVFPPAHGQVDSPQVPGRAFPACRPSPAVV